MKNITIVTAEKVIREIFKKQNTCSFRDINEYAKNHFNKNKYYDVSRDEIFYAVDINPDEFYWDYKEALIRKQEIFYCPLCNSIHRKYPHVETYNKLKLNMETYKNLSK